MKQVLRVLALVPLLALSACSSSNSSTKADVPELEIVVEKDPEPEEPAEKPQPEPVRAEAARPIEWARPVAEALRPRLAPLPDARVTGPRARSSEAERGELPLAKPTVEAATLPSVARKPPLPSPPVEGVPARVGEASEFNWRDVKFPERPAVKAPARREPTAADVPRLGYPVPDRIPMDDPTAEISTARIVQTSLVAAPMAVPFLRLVLPDPFEYAAHLKSPPVPEFATTPVLVPRARP